MTIEEYKRMEILNKSKFSSYNDERKQDLSSPYLLEKHKSKFLRQVENNYYNGMDDYIGVYSSNTAREMTASSSSVPKDVSMAMKDSFAKVNSVDAPVLFTCANKLGVKGSSVFPRIKHTSANN
eukprot:CAMPEP_0168320836 /NCGR_PEP_ID=MMETSP0213-20121227/1915_1 /TAXON_ID=151035 /ORGANISM="Euplotes harpa, Strain FSP1.4" /LENGTH=123 /DNA_ID=CAMNT_0008322377 /DNA_START=889 /DNA_END=1257 /DNA_ORIENTATION=+